jgi:hypothetical protein
MSSAQGTCQNTAIGGKRAAAESHLFNDSAANAYALSDECLEFLERCTEVTTASAGRVSGNGVSNEFAAFVNAVARSHRMNSGTFAACARVLGFRDTKLCRGGFIAARALAAGLCNRRGREGSFALFASLTRVVRTGAAGSDGAVTNVAGRSAACITRTRRTAFLLLLDGSVDHCLIDGGTAETLDTIDVLFIARVRGYFEQAEARSDAAQALVYTHVSLDMKRTPANVFVPSQPRCHAPAGIFFGGIVIGQ